MSEDKIVMLGLAVEFREEDVVEKQNDIDWCRLHCPISDRAAVVDIAGSTEEFFKLVKSMDEACCSQKFISTIKYARDIGTRWAQITLTVNGAD